MGGGGERRPPTPQASSAGASADPRLHSAEVTDKDRAGRAPYNFVPLPKALRPVGKPPSGDRYHCNLLSGEIHLTLEALTDFYVRGMWTLPQFRTKTVQDGDAERPVEVKDQTLPFCVDGELRIPGSSIRGMIRSLVEILGCSPLDPINDNPLFFRAVRASTYPEKPWFEPQAKTYRKRLGRKVRAGYLYGGPEHWVIRPAKNNKGDQPFYKIKRVGVCTSLPTTPHLVVGRSACRVGVGPSLNRSWAQRSRPVVQAGRRAFPR